MCRLTRADFIPVIEPAPALDKPYIPPRYPDGLAELTPAEAFTQSEAVGQRSPPNSFKIKLSNG
ncbi:hypothetical protein C7271_14275 [filamentous cyanobacterium CCP5]|nr:hypothetical protein C7271_14275 [filamentous cyanobacterium CCP5]